MKMIRLILLTLLGCSCGLTAAAQTAAGSGNPAPAPAFQWPPVDVPYAGPMQSFTAPNGMRVHVSPLFTVHSGEPVHLAENDRLCYSLRTYRFKRDQPGSDSTSLAGRGTCTSAASVHEKGVGAGVR